MRIEKQIDRDSTYRNRTVRITPGLWSKIQCMPGERIYLYYTNVPSGLIAVSAKEESFGSIINENNAILPLQTGESVPASFGDRDESDLYVTCLDDLGAHPYFIARFFVIENDNNRDRKREISPAPFKCEPVHSTLVYAGGLPPAPLFAENALRNSALIYFDADCQLCDPTGLILGTFFPAGSMLNISALDIGSSALYAFSAIANTFYITEFIIIKDF
jgi:hypothetical protein